MIDAFTAFGLAGTIAQFIDFTSKLISGTRSIASHGTSVNAQVLGVVTQDMYRLQENLTSRALKGAFRVSSELKDLAGECQHVARELLEVLDGIRRKGKGKIWKSFVIALKEIWKEKQIEEMSRRLEMLQRQFNTHMLAILL